MQRVRRRVSLEEETFLDLLSIETDLRATVTEAGPNIRIYRGEDHSPAAELERIRERVQEKYAPRIDAAGPVLRPIWRMLMRYELKSELGKHAQSMAGRL